MKLKQLWVLSFLILLLACNDRKSNTEVDAATPIEVSNTKSISITGAAVELDGTWILETFNTEIIDNTDAYRVPTLKIEADEGNVIGNAGCNQYSGKIEVQAGKQINIQAERVSELDCSESSLEDDFLKAITTKDLNYEMQDNNQMIFYSDNITLMFKKSR